MNPDRIGEIKTEKTGGVAKLPKKTLNSLGLLYLETGLKMKEVASLLALNRLIYGLSIVGGLFMVLYAADPGGGLPANPTLIAFGIAAVIFSSLIYKIVQVFAIHVEKSHAQK